MKTVDEKIIIKLIGETEKKTDSGLILSKTKTMYHKGTVLVVGPEISDIAVNDTVFFIDGAGHEIGDGIIVINKKDVLCYGES